MTSRFTAANFLATFIGALALHAGSSLAAYPDKPIKVVVPFSAGGGGDIAARLVAEELRKSLHVPMVIENRPGANGLIGAAYLAKAAPDGYTIGYSTNTVHAGGYAVFRSMPFHPINDFAPIALTMSSPLVLAVGAESAVRTVAQMRDWISANPQTASYSYHNGGSQVAGNLFVKRIDAKAIAVPYVSPTAAAADIVGGVTSFGFFEPTTIKALIDGQRIRPLAVSAKARLPLLPDVPTFQEVGLPDLNIRNWGGFFAPAGTPQHVLDTLASAIQRAMAEPSVRDKARAIGMTEEFLPPARFRAFIEDEATLWKVRYRDAGIEPK